MTASLTTMSEAGGIEASYTDSGSQELPSMATDVSKDAKIERDSEVKPRALISFSISQSGIVIEYTFEKWVSFEPMKKCSNCDRETPFVFHMAKFLTYRLCWAHMSHNETSLVARMYGVMDKAREKLKVEI